MIKQRRHKSLKPLRIERFEMIKVVPPAVVRMMRRFGKTRWGKKITEHGKHVAGMSEAIMRKMVALKGKQMTCFDGRPVTLAEVAAVGLCHDFGKFKLGKEVLTKKDLSKMQRKRLQTHVSLPPQIEKELNPNVVDAIFSHQEKWDGSGYPRGLKGTDIPFATRIVAVADAFYAMTEGRTYKKRRTVVEAIKEISMNSGKQFDPVVVKAFLAVMLDFRYSA